MGMFDTFANEDDSLAIQVKTGPCCLLYFKIGDCVDADFADGIIAAPEGFVVIHNGIVRSVTKTYPSDVPDGLKCVTKWGDPFDPTTDSLNDKNPYVLAIAELARKYEKGPHGT